MKYLIIGLGNFGSTLATNLTALGHEVIGIDRDKNKVNNLKDRITHTICLDAGDASALGTLPIKDIDIAVVGIGEDFGASVLATALVKQLGPKRLVSRAINDIHQTIIDAIGVDEIVRPEEDSAERLAVRLCTKGVVDLFKISSDHSIVEINLPESLHETAVGDANLREKYNLNILTVLRKKEYRNIIGNKHFKSEVIGVVSPETEFRKGDILVLFGKMENIKRFMEDM